MSKVLPEDFLGPREETGEDTEKITLFGSFI